MTVICRLGESLAECHEDLKRRFKGIKIAQDEIGGEKGPLKGGKGEGHESVAIVPD